jgi:hypothetical protein
MRLRDAIIDKEDGDWLSCGPYVVAAISGAPLTTVERVFRCFGSDGVATKAIDVAWRSPPSATRPNRGTWPTMGGQLPAR